MEQKATSANDKVAGEGHEENWVMVVPNAVENSLEAEKDE
jgi:hypothetical protein